MVAIKKKNLKERVIKLKAAKIEKQKSKKLKNPEVPKAKIIKDVAKELSDVKKDAAQKKKAKYVMPSVSVTDDVVNSCLKVLLDVIVNDKKKNAIFDDEKPIFAEIHCIKIQNTRGNIKFLLPHSTVASTGEICLITPDIKKGRKHDHEPTVDKWEDILRNAGMTQVKTVLPVRQLKVEYDQFELKRRLLTQHDFIMVDTRVLNHVSHLLGKMFFKKHNMLVPVRMNEQNVKSSIDVGLRTAILRLSEGETSTITIGHTAMSHDKLRENIWPSATIKPPKLTQKRPKHYTVLEDELSTIPGKTVRVAPDGTVHIKKDKKAPVSDAEDTENEVEEDGEEEQQSEEESE